MFVMLEYNRSIPGWLKNAIDWAGRPRAPTPFVGECLPRERRARC